MTEEMWWYATRAAGLMTWLTATAAVVIGLAVSLRIVRSRTGAWLVDLHRFLGGISAVFLIAHVGTLYADSHFDFTPRELFIPGESTWESEAIAWGIIAAYALIAVEITSLLSGRIRRRVWWIFHALSFVTAGAGTYHAWIVGSDVRNPVAWTIAGAGTVMVLGFVALRLQRRQQEADPAGIHLGDRESLLLEMRQRLEDLPVPQAPASPRIDVDPSAVLPRRASPAPQDPSGPPASPFGDAAPGPGDAPASDPVDAPAPRQFPDQPFTHDPFDALQLEGDTPQPPPSPPRPFPDPISTGQPVDRRDLFDPAPPPPTEPTPAPFDPTPTEPPQQPTYPFEAAPAPAPGLTPPPEFDSMPPPAPAGAPADLFSPATPEEAEHHVGNPFNPVDPPPASISVPVDEPGPAAAPAPPPTPTSSPDAVPAAATEPPSDGPPPLPVDAVDPETGEPDEAAYSAWLKEWLAFAESYGDSTPDDPSRV